MKTKSTYKYNQGRVRVLEDILPVAKFLKFNKVLFEYIIGSGKYRVDFFGGYSYDGELKYYQKHGRGKETFASGGIYDGEWKEDKRHGRGKLTYANRYVYDGEWQDDKWHGKGKLTWYEGEVYEGEWKDGQIMISLDNAKKKNKTPTLVIRSNRIHIEDRLLKYETHKHLPGGKEVEVIVCENKEESTKAISNFSKGRESGDKCRIVFDQHGDRGGVNDLKIDKQGAKEILEDLAKKFKHITISDLSCNGGTSQHFIDIARDFAKNNKVKIKIRFAPEDRKCIDVLKWKGEQSRFALATIGKDGSGKSREKIEFGTNGICTLTNGDQYKGEWRDGKKHGRGTYTCTNGIVYDCVWKDDKKHYIVKYTCANGIVYRGEWQGNKIYGKGKCILANGDVYEGERKEGKKHGQGTEKYANGDVYEGKWKEGKKHGQGTEKYANGDIYEGEWKEGKLHDIGIYTDSNGNAYECEWEEGKLVSNTKLSKNITDCEEVKRQELKTTKAFSTKHEFIPGRHINSQDYTQIIAKAETKAEIICG